ncbi:hypothetical protein [Lentzea flava]|uniref:Uncharacterized protein n=1 Tax=Lentzea flava TaxID=103732 RepID=A0ABQ2UN52_9PSEU|nr:hypothetical protein [Lentzea flava]MCP2200023.1 hypothetical protein [Lentzea flava]GGU45622.1 hypothetical protein GCM10010178_42570 [Lentzea flava]
MSYLFATKYADAMSRKFAKPRRDDGGMLKWDSDGDALIPEPPQFVDVVLDGPEPEDKRPVVKQVPPSSLKAVTLRSA